MRLFIAADICGEFLKETKIIQKRLKACGADIKWTAEENMHFTFHFLGEVATERLGYVKKALEPVSQISSFTVQLSDLGTFPPKGRPKIIWLGIKDETEGMSRIFQILENELKAKGFETEKRQFTAHLTIGRVKSSKCIDELNRKITKLNDTFKHPELEINCVNIINSVLTSSGPVYTVVHSVKLRDKK